MVYTGVGHHPPLVKIGLGYMYQSSKLGSTLTLLLWKYIREDETRQNVSRANLDQ